MAIQEYKCPACGGPLRFDPKEQSLVCPYCESRFTMEEVMAAEENRASQTDEGPTPESESFDWAKYKQTLSDAPMDDTLTYLCRSCGAEIAAEVNTSATTCPYCGNNVVLTGRVSGGLRPNAILPFRISQKELPEYLRRFYKKKPLLPRDFFKKYETGDLQGIYVPFWLYDLSVSGYVEFNGKRVRHYTQGEYDVTETSHFLLKRDGQVSFSGLPVDASKRMENDLMDSLEPYDYSDLREYNGAYLSGYLADRFDEDPDTCMPRAEERVMNSTLTAFEGTASTYTGVTVHENHMHLTDPAVRYALLPVYLLNCEYGGKKYRCAVNGQTGKVVGDLPLSKAKLRAWFWGVFAAAAGLSMLLQMIL